jgi:hypothetical protein
MPTDRDVTVRPAAVPAVRTAPGSGHRGICNGRTAYARETASGNWQVKVHDPTNRLAGHDGWVLVGTGWATLDDARAATGLT